MEVFCRLAYRRETRPEVTETQRHPYEFTQEKGLRLMIPPEKDGFDRPTVSHATHFSLGTLGHCVKRCFDCSIFVHRVRIVLFFAASRQQ